MIAAALRTAHRREASRVGGEVVFPQTVTSCGSSVTASQYVGGGLIGVNPDFSDPPDVSHVFFSVYFRNGFPSHIVIGEYDKTGTLRDGPFTISMRRLDL